jgi:hypothetical protein
MTRFSLAMCLALCSRNAVSTAFRDCILKLERAKRWASERAAIKAEVGRAKETLDLLRMAKAVTRLDALEAEIEAAGKADLAKRRKA